MSVRTSLTAGMTGASTCNSQSAATRGGARARPDECRVTKEEQEDWAKLVRTLQNLRNRVESGGSSLGMSERAVLRRCPSQMYIL